jgi:hypothetical protein
MNPGNFFSELKRSNVYKIAIAYAVVVLAAHSNRDRSFFCGSKRPNEYI